MTVTFEDVRSSDHPLDRAAASRDLWPLGTLERWQGRPAPEPDRVWWPRDAEQVALVLREAQARGVAVVPYGAGSGVCGGARGREGSWTLDTKALDTIGPVDVARREVTVGAGVNGQILEDHLAALGWTVGHSPSSIGCSTVGGWAAARGAGQFSSRYGVFEDMIVGLTAVAPGRGVFRIGEGGDAPASWLPLLLGSEGTLAVITSVTIRVHPSPAARWLRGYRFGDVESGLDAIRRLMQAELWPAAVRLYDPIDTRIGGSTKPKGDASSRAWLSEGLALVDRLPGVRRHSLALPLGLPGLVNRVLAGLSSGCLVVVGWEGAADVVEAATTAAAGLLSDAEDLGSAPGERWYASRHAVSYKLMPIFERGGFADTMEVAARWSVLPRVYHEVRAAVAPHAVVMAHASHAYPEGGSWYFSFAGRGDADVYRRVWQAGLAAATAAGATCTHHHGVGELKAAAASAEAGPARRFWRELRGELDPGGVMNPGRVYDETPSPTQLSPETLSDTDGLVRVAANADGETRRRAAAPGEPLWAWERIEGPARWHRLPWQTGRIEVDGHIDGSPVRLGRAPRSAAGPDLRDAVVAFDPSATATFGVAPPGARAMAEADVPNPWSAALDLLRADLRPAWLGVVDGRLRIGFRGPAAAGMLAVAAARLGGALRPIDWDPRPLPCGPFETCDADDPRACAVSLGGVLRLTSEVA